MKRKIWYTYDDIHRVIKGLAEKIQNSGTKYDAMIGYWRRRFYPCPHVALLLGNSDLRRHHSLLRQ